MATSCIAEQTIVTDPDLLALEFEAIVAANYPPSAGRPARRPPTLRCATATGVRPAGDDPRGHASGHHRIPATGRRPHARQRSPPARRSRSSTDVERRHLDHPVPTGPVAASPRTRHADPVRARHPHLDPRATSVPPAHDRPRAPRRVPRVTDTTPGHWPRPSSDNHDPVRLRRISTPTHREKSRAEPLPGRAPPVTPVRRASLSRPSACSRSARHRKRCSPGDGVSVASASTRFG